MSLRPPKLPEKLFRVFCGQAFVEDLLGDLHEVYLSKAENKGKLYAIMFYWRQVLSLIFSYAITKRKQVNKYESYRNNNTGIMLKSYLKISFRTIIKQKVFTAINIIGLALGMSIALLAIAMFIELKAFDGFHPGADNIYRVTTTVNRSGNKLDFASSPAALAQLAQESIPDIENGVLISDKFFPSVESVGEPIKLHGYLTQPQFFDMFSFPLVEGSKHALSEPGKAIITHELAEKLFGEKSAMNQVIKTEASGNLIVAGVLAPFPKRTHFEFDLLAMYPKKSMVTDWSDFHGNYYYFKSKAKPMAIKNSINGLGKNGLVYFEDDEEVVYDVQALGDITPGPIYEDGIGVIFDFPTMLLFFGTALLILVPAVMNYINMAIAAALRRSKEVGIRKVAGSTSRQIVHQFLVETIMICFGALVLSLVMFVYLRSAFQDMLMGATALSFELTPLLLISFMLFTLILGLATGMIPAFFFAKISPIVSLRGKAGGGKVSVSGLRKVLMVFQFIVSLVFMIGIGVLVRQYQHTLTFNMGFHKENILVVPIPKGNTQLLENEFLTNGKVIEMSFSNSIPGTSLSGVNYFHTSDGLDSIRVREVLMSSNYISHMGLELVAGQSIVDNTQLEQVLVNQTLQNSLKTLNNGEEMFLHNFGKNTKVAISGIVKDYNHEPLNESMEPIVFRVNASNTSFALISIIPDDLTNTLQQLEAKWDGIHENIPFKASFLETEIEKAHDFFTAAFKIFGFLGVLAVSITSLGLLGMVIYSTENRAKEVAIRKTLGAKVTDLAFTLAGGYLKLWLIALVIALPTSYIFYDTVFVSIYNKYSGGVSAFEILISTFFTILVAGFSIFTQTYKAMRSNPVNSLRME